MICAAGVDVNHCDKDGINALFSATMRTKDIEVYRALIECGIDINYVCKRGPKCDIISGFIDFAEIKDPEVEIDNLYIFNILLSLLLHQQSLYLKISTL